MGGRLLLYSTYVVNGIVRQVYNLMKLCDMLNPQVFISIYYYQFVLCVVQRGRDSEGVGQDKRFSQMDANTRY